jgi:hypothetical protein
MLVTAVANAAPLGQFAAPEDSFHTLLLFITKD